MNELPKSVRDELARQQQPGAAHPDADLLTAFAEGTATPAERARIEQHLATCNDCREVLFLATPTSEAAAPVVTAPKVRARWYPVWAPWAAAAAILVTATFTFVRRDQEALHKTAARNETAAAIAKIAPGPDPKAEQEAREQLHYANPNDAIVVSKNPLKDAPARSDSRERDKRASLDELKKDGSRQKEDRGDATSFGVVAGAVDNKQSGALASAGAAPAPAPPASVVAATPASGDANRAARNMSLKPGPAAPAQNQIFQNQQNQMQGNRTQDLNAAKAAQSTTVEVATEAVEVQATPNEFALEKTKNRGQWRISSDGQLEHLTSGNTWTQVLVPNNTKLTVVANIGQVVWAGGTNGVLFRSDNNGTIWQPILLPGLIPGNGPTITRIQFRDAFVGTVTAADGRYWYTKDRGNSWQQH